MKLNHKYPRVQILGTKIFGGENLLPLDVLQYSEMIKIVIKGLNMNKQCLKPFIISYKNLQLESGTNNLPLFSTIPKYITSKTCIMHLWIYTKKYQSKLYIQSEFKFKIQRVNDRYIMDENHIIKWTRKNNKI